MGPPASLTATLRPASSVGSNDPGVPMLAAAAKLRRCAVWAQLCPRRVSRQPLVTVDLEIIVGRRLLSSIGSDVESLRHKQRKLLQPSSNCCFQPGLAAPRLAPSRAIFGRNINLPARDSSAVSAVSNDDSIQLSRVPCALKHQWSHQLMPRDLHYNPWPAQLSISS